MNEAKNNSDEEQKKTEISIMEFGMKLIGLLNIFQKAPEDGLFSFMWTNVTKGGKQFHTEIVLNGKIIGYNHVNGVSGSSHWASGTSSAVIKMKRKDEVWIRTDGSFGLYAYADWSSFTGFKL
ncbi:uncharacterized protein LOC134241244 [Saccostrea cucullata]|uniref:uncharacterized protein LOC134241244 n=1 Tax=Saccostrea cuccullata TaxID=36930 RepID=UPI002ED43E31